tara:strand:- start:2272 stop:2760 length:489 start_codon:yes stop_codon:yes gene_type:complete
MKTVTRLGLLILSISLLSFCKKEEDSNDTTPTLSTFLKGNFNITRTDYNGSLSTALGTVPANGTGTSTSGSFLFESFTKTTTYLLSTNMEVGSDSYPLYFGGAGTFQILDETSFSINDAITGSTTYEVSSRTENSMVLSRGYDLDTLGGNASLVLNLYLTKD